MTAAISSSGGKDSLLALHRARALGIDVTTMITMITMFDDVSGLSKSHGVSRSLMEAQAKALGLLSITPPSGWTNYQDVFVETLTSLRADGHDTVVCVDSRFLADDFAGRPFDASFLADLPPNVDPCGENGEFHTFVTNGPGFSHPLEVAVGGKRAYISSPEFGSQRYCFAELSG